MPHSITALKGITKKTAALLSQLDIYTIQDLLFHLPSRYEDRSRIYALSEIKPGDRVLVEGVIQSCQVMGGRRRYLKCVVQEGLHKLDLVFYYYVYGYQKKLSKMTGKMRFFGEVRLSFSGHLEMIHPECAAIESIVDGSALSLSPCLLPVYPATKGLTQRAIRNLMQQALALLLQEKYLSELLPPIILKKFNFMSLGDALRLVHAPSLDISPAALIRSEHPAQHRLIFEELVAHQLAQQQLRQLTRKNKGVALPRSSDFEKKCYAQFSFQLTAAQQRVIQEIQQDLLRPVPMLRLLQGDVGSGKTVVACVAALQAIASHYQVALMAPTEVLCEQHYKNFTQWLLPLGASVSLLTGKQTTAEQKQIKTQLQSGEIHLIIGTHALFQNDVQFRNLALLIIDEQHRFGVEQRLMLMEKGVQAGFAPHQLIMTATPIPRTLTMAAYADLDVSIIDELPPNRKPISTVLLSNEKRDQVIARLKNHCGASQAYWICTLIDESESLQCQAAEKTVIELRQQLPDLRIGLVHGRLKSEEKNALMMAFKKNALDLLVATTVVEVGVDVPNATLMIIENAERLGLSQLHQLRGRVGRGEKASFCVLLYQHPLSEMAKKRLSIMRETQDGFAIAEQDLQIRGPGDMLGVRQSGIASLRFANLLRDQHLLSAARDISQEILNNHAESAVFLIERWIGSEKKYLKI